MIDKRMKFDLDDIVIIPTIESYISSRSECTISNNFESILLKEDTLPIFTSPMDTVINCNNIWQYIINGIIPCLPRNHNCHNDERHILNKYYFKSFGLSEIEQQLNDNLKNDNYYFYNYDNVLIDIANGHMSKLINIIKKIKKSYPNIKLMVGNVANPLTYKNLSLAGADYIRLSIGSGNVCTTSANLGVHYPIGSLIHECRKIKEESNLTSKIILDGGVKSFADIIKALALGADYIQAGSIFNKSLESSGFNYIKILNKKFKIKNKKLIKLLWKYKIPLYKKYRGMSTKEVQKSWGKKILTTSEGITKYQRVEYTLKQWTDNFKDYLKSAMSYSGAKNLNEFIGKAEWVFITNNAFKRYNK